MSGFVIVCILAAGCVLAVSRFAAAPSHISSQPPKELRLALSDTLSMELTLIPAGTFAMGSPLNEPGRRDEEPQRTVQISTPFYMGTYEVTRRQFAAFVQETGYKTDAEKEGWAYVWGPEKWEKEPATWRHPLIEQTDDHPVVCVSHNDAEAFCQWLSRKTGRRVSLPTEAQWEYACRAGTRTAYIWGDDWRGGKEWCNTADVTGKRQQPNFDACDEWEDGFVFTAPVGSFKPNAWGLYDMIGNVFEWCGDRCDELPDVGDTTKIQVDPVGAASGKYYAARGGAWFYHPRRCRSAARSKNEPTRRGTHLGLRVVVAT